MTKKDRGRTGKVARLPHATRELLNRRIRDGERGVLLVKWLNSLPETQAVVSKEFNGKPVSSSNLTEWKQGGYRSWLSKQEAFEQMCLAMEAPAKFGPDSAQSLTERLAQWLSIRCLVEVHRQEESETDLDLAAFGRLCRSLAALRRGDHSVRRLELEAARLDLRLGTDSKKLNDLFWEWTKRPEIQEKLRPKPLTPEQRDRKFNEIFGIAQDDEFPDESEHQMQRENRKAQARRQETEAQRQKPKVPSPASEVPGSEGCEEPPAGVPKAPGDAGDKAAKPPA